MTEPNQIAEAPRALVIGHPIKHSRSPLIHRYWLKKYAISGDYDIADVPPDNLAGFIADFAKNNIAGANLTIPHKQLVLDMVEKVDDVSRAIGAANTIWRDAAGALNATNTDWTGFLSALDQQAPGWDADHGEAVIFGAGGAARAVIYGLIDRQFEKITVINRTASRIDDLIRDFGPVVAHPVYNLGEQLARASLVVNTSSLGMSGSAPWPYDLDGLNPSAVVNDIVYAPLKTELLRLAQARGNRTVDGLWMLLHQAAPGFQKWFGIVPDVDDDLRKLIVANLEHG